MVVLFVFIAFFILFFLNFRLGEKLAVSSRSFEIFGTNFLNKKERQLRESALFGSLRKAIAKPDSSKAFLTILPLMLLKSAAFYFVGLVLVLPLLLIVQGLMMGTLFNAYKKSYASNGLFVKVTFWQLSSHLILGAYGFVVGLNWFFEIDLLTGIEPNWLADMESYMGLSVIWAIVAAYLEVKMLIRDNKVRSL